MQVPYLQPPCQIYSYIWEQQVWDQNPQQSSKFSLTNKRNVILKTYKALFLQRKASIGGQRQHHAQLGLWTSISWQSGESLERWNWVAECLDFSMYLPSEIIFVWKTCTLLPRCILYFRSTRLEVQSKHPCLHFCALGQSSESSFLTFHSFFLCNEEWLEACIDFFFFPQLLWSLICHQQVPGHSLEPIPFPIYCDKKFLSYEQSSGSFILTWGDGKPLMKSSPQSG